jgi:CheY-like chemotaxis protein
MCHAAADDQGQGGRVPSVLIVDNDSVIAQLVGEMLTDEGYQVKVLLDTSAIAVQTAVVHDFPSCVVLDGRGHDDYGESWQTAAWLKQRPAPVPVIMLTGHRRVAEEARAGETPRSQAASFVAILEKPFNLDDLVAAVGRAVCD